MQFLVLGFFLLFFIVSIIGIIVRLHSMYTQCTHYCNARIHIELYDDQEISADVINELIDRTSDQSVRSSVKYHNGLYKPSHDYEIYRTHVRKLELP